MSDNSLKRVSIISKFESLHLTLLSPPIKSVGDIVLSLNMRTERKCAYCSHVQVRPFNELWPLNRLITVLCARILLLSVITLLYLNVLSSCLDKIIFVTTPSICWNWVWPWPVNSLDFKVQIIEFCLISAVLCYNFVICQWIAFFYILRGLLSSWTYLHS